MIYVFIQNKLRSFEADIRDLCLAFFPYKKINYIYDEMDMERVNSVCSHGDIIVKDYFAGDLIGNRKAAKSELKRQLYNCLKNITHKELLWGTLTGIRPVNIVTELYESNKIEQDEFKDDNLINADSKVREYLKNEYYLSREKANKLIRIAKNEINILDRADVSDYKDRYSIYIGVPFCKSTCLYCSFTSFNIDKFGNYVDRYLDALEMEFRKKLEEKLILNDRDVKNGRFTPMTVYIGGGTPTSLSAEQFERLLILIKKYIDMDNCIEYTIEAGRPDTIDSEKLKLMKDYGVKRISINPQTFNQKTLDLIGRKHTIKDIINKYQMARKEGFDNINMDIILGLPGEHLLGVMKTLYNVCRLKPDSLTVHSLALKRAARLNLEFGSWTSNYYLAGLAESSDREGCRQIDKMYHLSELISDLLKYKPYYLYRQKNMAGNLENVGYAIDGKECIYNIMMMSERHTVCGFGTATSKFVFYENGEKRIESVEGYKSVVDYCSVFLDK